MFDIVTFGHPSLKMKSQDVVNFDNELAKMIPATYIEFTQNPELFTHEASPNKSWATAISRGWTVFSLKSSHNAQRSNPHKLADLLERAVK